MGAIKASMGQLLVEAAALTTLATLVALLISVALIRLLELLRSTADEPEQQSINQRNEMRPF